MKALEEIKSDEPAGYVSCKYCGANEIKIKLSTVIEGFYIQCTGCENSSASCKTRELAVLDWNERNET